MQQGRIEWFGRRIGPVLLACLLFLPAAPARSVELHAVTGVIELFTSQGCSSCPPADRVLAELAGRPDTLALGWHVDYWDYLGWKDTFGSKASTKRQKAYSISLGRRGVYTPQAVINGRFDVVGSRGIEVMKTLDRARGTDDGMTVPITAEIRDGMMTVTVEATPQAQGATLWMVYFDDGEAVKIERGENRGHTLRYANIVRDAEMIGMVRHKTLQTEFMLKDLSRRGYDSCALILQKATENGTPGAIVGAALLRNIGS